MRLTGALLTRNWPVSRLTYSHSGESLLALASNGVHSLWKWQKNDKNETEAPSMYRPPSGDVMINELNTGDNENPLSCFELSEDDTYLVSLSGGSVGFFNTVTFKNIRTFSSTPPHPMCIAFHPKDISTIAMGMADSFIHIYNHLLNKVETNLQGHEKEVTGLAFSTVLNVLVSSGADAQLCVWSTDTWKKLHNKFILPPDQVTSLARIHVQFHPEQKQFIAVHDTLLAIYDASELECVKQWTIENSEPLITNATYSCNGELIYASFRDGRVRVLEATTLAQRFWICPKEYIKPAHIRTSNRDLYATVVAAHPSESNQFAVGLTNGGVYILQPVKSEGKWGTLLVLEHDESQRNVSGQASSDDHEP